MDIREKQLLMDEAFRCYVDACRRVGCTPPAAIMRASARHPHMERLVEACGEFEISIPKSIELIFSKPGKAGLPPFPNILGGAYHRNLMAKENSYQIRKKPVQERSVGQVAGHVPPTPAGAPPLAPFALLQAEPTEAERLERIIKIQTPKVYAAYGMDRSEEWVNRIRLDWGIHPLTQILVLYPHYRMMEDPLCRDMLLQMKVNQEIITMLKRNYPNLESEMIPKMDEAAAYFNYREKLVAEEMRRVG